LTLLFPTKRKYETTFKIWRNTGVKNQLPIRELNSSQKEQLVDTCRKSKKFSDLGYGIKHNF